MSRHVGRGETRYNSMRDTPSHRDSPFKAFSEGQFVRCPNCSCLTTMGDIIDGCPGCGYNPVREQKRRDLIANARVINRHGAHKVVEMNDRQFARLVGQFRRRVA